MHALDFRALEKTSTALENCWANNWKTAAETKERQESFQIEQPTFLLFFNSKNLTGKNQPVRFQVTQMYNQNMENWKFGHKTKL